MTSDVTDTTPYKSAEHHLKVFKKREASLLLDSSLCIKRCIIYNHVRKCFEMETPIRSKFTIQQLHSFHKFYGACTCCTWIQKTLCIFLQTIRGDHCLFLPLVFASKYCCVLTGFRAKHRAVICLPAPHRPTYITDLDQWSALHRWVQCLLFGLEFVCNKFWGKKQVLKNWCNYLNLCFRVIFCGLFSFTQGS